MAIVGNFSLGKGMLWVIVVKEKSIFGNSGLEIQNFSDFGPENAKNWQFLSRNHQLMALLMQYSEYLV